MSPKIIAHPETGQPVRAIVSYQDLDMVQLQDTVTARQAELDAIVAEETAHQAVAQDILERKTKAEAALGDSKSELATYHELAGTSGDAGQEGTSGPLAGDAPAGTESAAPDQSAAYPGHDSGADTQTIPVTVADQY